MVVVLGGVGQLAGTVSRRSGLGVLNKFLEGLAGAVLAKIMVLVFIVVFIQKRPQGHVRDEGPERGSMSAATCLDAIADAVATCRAAGAAARRARAGPRVRRWRCVVVLRAACRCSTWWCRRTARSTSATTRVALVGKIMCYAICALAMDLIWGYTGILSLGHGLFFALGGYAMGMYLMRQIGRDGNYQSRPARLHGVPRLEGAALALGASATASSRTLLLVVLVPGLLAFVFGFFAFRSRIKGVYFSIITQAMTFAAMLLFFRNETGFGGNNGFTDFKRILGMPIATPSMRMTLFVAHRAAR